MPPEASTAVLQIDGLQKLAGRGEIATPSAASGDVLAESPRLSLEAGANGRQSIGAFSTTTETAGAPAWAAVVRRVQAEEVAREHVIAELTAYVEQTFSSLAARLEAVERNADRGVPAVVSESQEAHVHALVADRCQVVTRDLEATFTHNLEARFTQVETDTSDRLRKLDDAVTSLTEALEASKQRWREDAKQLWEAVDSHTHEVNVDDSQSESVAASVQPPDLQEFSVAEVFNDSTLDLTQVQRPASTNGSVTVASSGRRSSGREQDSSSLSLPPGPPLRDRVTSSPVGKQLTPIRRMAEQSQADRWQDSPSISMTQSPFRADHSYVVKNSVTPPQWAWLPKHQRGEEKGLPQGTSPPRQPIPFWPATDSSNSATPAASVTTPVAGWGISNSVTPAASLTTPVAGWGSPAASLTTPVAGWASPAASLTAPVANLVAIASPRHPGSPGHPGSKQSMGSPGHPGRLGSPGNPGRLCSPGHPALQQLPARESTDDITVSFSTPMGSALTPTAPAPLVLRAGSVSAANGGSITTLASTDTVVQLATVAPPAPRYSHIVHAASRSPTRATLSRSPPRASPAVSSRQASPTPIYTRSAGSLTGPIATSRQTSPLRVVPVTAALPSSLSPPRDVHSPRQASVTRHAVISPAKLMEPILHASTHVLHTPSTQAPVMQLQRQRPNSLAAPPPSLTGRFQGTLSPPPSARQRMPDRATQSLNRTETPEHGATERMSSLRRQQHQQQQQQQQRPPSRSASPRAAAAGQANMGRLQLMLAESRSWMCTQQPTGATGPAQFA